MQPVLLAAVFITSTACLSGQEASSDGPLAIVGDTRVGLWDLPANVRGQLNRLRSEEYQLLRRAVDQKIDEILIALAAPLPSVGDQPRVLELLAVEGLSPEPVTRGEVKGAYELTKERYPGLSPEDAFAKIRGEMEARRLATSRQALLEKLRARASIGYFIHPVRVKLETEGKPVQ
jgi:hypothetical protein